MAPTDSSDGQRVFTNQLPQRLSRELAEAQALGIRPLRLGDPGFEAVINAGLVKWAVSEEGELLIVPHTVGNVEIAHSVLTGGRPVLAAGQADLASGAGRVVGLEINNFSGHYQPDSASLAIGREAFARAGITFAREWTVRFD